MIKQRLARAHVEFFSADGSFSNSFTGHIVKTYHQSWMPRLIWLKQFLRNVDELSIHFEPFKVYIIGWMILGQKCRHPVFRLIELIDQFHRLKLSLYDKSSWATVPCMYHTEYVGSFSRWRTFLPTDIGLEAFFFSRSLLFFGHKCRIAINASMPFRCAGWFSRVCLNTYEWLMRRNYFGCYSSAGLLNLNSLYGVYHASFEPILTCQRIQHCRARGLEVKSAKWSSENGSVSVWLGLLERRVRKKKK